MTCQPIRSFVSKSGSLLLVWLFCCHRQQREDFANSWDPDETAHDEPSHQDLSCRARENRKNSRSGPKLRILDRFQTPQNANKSVQHFPNQPIFTNQWCLKNHKRSSLSKLTTSSFLFWSTRFVGPRFDKWIPKPCKSWSDVAYNGVGSGYIWLLPFFFFFVDIRNTRV